MKKLSFFLFANAIALNFAFSQGTAINTTGAAADNSAILDVASTTKGLLIPRMTEVEKSAISNPADGLMVYQTDGATGIWVYNAGTSAWAQLASNYYGDDSGSSNTFNVSIASSVGSYFKGMHIDFMSNQCITGPAALDVNGLGPIPIKKNVGVDLKALDIAAGQIVSVIYDGTFFQLLSPAGLVGLAENSYAGPDIVTTQSTVTMSANPPSNEYDRGRWSVVSGTGGSFADIYDPQTDFTGVIPNIYNLRWTVFNSCDSTYDDVQITLIPQPTKRVFVSSVDYNGNLGGLTGADNKCQTLANNAALSGTFKAWISTSAESAKNRIGICGWKRIDNVYVAGSITDLTDGSIMNPINVDENGNVRNNVYVWTGTDNNGNWSSWLDCYSWTSSGSSSFERSHIGNTSQTNSWSLNYYDYCNLPFALFCFEQ